MAAWTQALPYFSKRELRCQGTGRILLDLRFAVALPYLRQQWGEPLFPTSVCRTPEHNKREGGHPRSLHLTENPKRPTKGCMAADIYWASWSPERKLKFARLAWRLGWSVGLHPDFCHVDRRKEIGLRQAVFVYDDWNDQFGPGEVPE